MAFSNHSVWSGFYKKAIKERQAQLKLVFPDLFTPLTQTGPSPSGNGQLTRSSVTQLLKDHQLNINTSINFDDASSSTQLGEWKSSSNLAKSTDELNRVSSTGGESNGGVMMEELFPVRGLDEQIADNMIENCIGTLGLPVGLALNFTINSNPIIIPMCMEEPSVVAAASGAAKTISAYGGFKATTTERNIVIAQVQILDVRNVVETAQVLRTKTDSIVEVANQYCESMAKRGGGVKHVTVRLVPRFGGPNGSTQNTPNYWLVVHLHIDVCDAMGANCASTVAEGTAPFLGALTGGRIGLRIVSNMCVERLAKATFRVPVSGMNYKNLPGPEVCSRVIEAYQWALDDPFRGTTHNKGIMNGIDAVALATGQDWRAIEAAAHGWASGAASIDQEGQALLSASATRKNYKPLTRYWIDGDYFCGELEMPLSVGTRGGVLRTNPVYSYTLGMMGNPTAKELAMAMVSVGLAQNLAALRALSTEGIQRGHMSLHSRNIAVAAGAPPHAITECVEYMIQSNRIHITAAREYLIAHELNATVNRISNADTERPQMKNLSIFYFEEAVGAADEKGKIPGLEDHVTLNIAFQSVGKKPVSLELVPDQTSPHPLILALFGEKTHAWLTWIFGLLDSVRLSLAGPERANVLLAKKLKVLSVLLNLVVRRLMVSYPLETRRFVDRVFSDVRLKSKTSASPALSRRRPAIVQAYVQSTKEMVMTEEGIPPPRMTEIPTGTTPLGGLNWDLSKSPIFQRDVMAGLDLDEAPELLQVGLPLMLALWQVFEIRVVQWVGSRDLVRELLQEQRRVMSNLVATPLGAGWAQLSAKHDGWTPDIYGSNPSSPDSPGVINRETFRELMAIHGKRFQVTLLLLCDAVSFGPRSVNATVLRFLRKLGGYLEWEQARAHDISPRRLHRDLQALKSPQRISCPAANGFIAWLEVVQGLTTNAIYDRAHGANHTPPSLTPISANPSAPTSPNVPISPFTPDVSKNENDALPLPAISSKSSLPPLYRRLAREIQEFISFTDRQKLRKELMEAANALGAGFEQAKVLRGAKLYRRYYEVSTLFGDHDLVDTLGGDESDEYDSDDGGLEEFAFE
ncbi:hydroxymethylglutaryl-CoA reductase (NADPH) [Synchytrium endobioticum]|uniref:3-hydroxy-3-methylglutaryl coenzyme A reductase n=1 Tax=Synchytrium endobioticum TaxID=286115 RepID=A0A507DKI6_9FUNG|nr:hydroxymethylglutaryl-CoA reductase (NADPH) [Synchytrium endobioticum]TPX51931.1 hydroxymethylglutaryl-CoA reductase (NADPH) [Synchytrium endobioticum]